MAVPREFFCKREFFLLPLAWAHISKKDLPLALFFFPFFQTITLPIKIVK